MRIRSILPDFYRSEDIGAMDWDTRMVFVGLWSYVDDNGVGRDSEGLIAADLFPFDLSRDSRETLARVSRALDVLAEGSRGTPQIHRYEVEGKPYLYICGWTKYQRVDKPTKPRYPFPYGGTPQVRPDEAFLADMFSRHSRDTLASPRDTLAPGGEEERRRGGEEKGRRGEGSAPASADTEPRVRARTQTATPSPTVVEAVVLDDDNAPTNPTDQLNALIATYPGRSTDVAALDRELKKAIRDGANFDAILAGARTWQAAVDAGADAQYFPDAFRWITQRSWMGKPPPPPDTRSKRQRDRDAREQLWVANAQEYEDTHAEAPGPRQLEGRTA